MAPVHRKVNLTLDIAALPSLVFEAITDLPGYNTWLPHSGNFKGTTEVSETPIRTGTKYTEREPSGTRHGEVQLLDEASRHVIFHQPMKLKPYILGFELDIAVDMTVKEREGGEGSTLDREVRLGIPASLGLVAGRIEKMFRDESWRTMEQLKQHLESSHAEMVDGGPKGEEAAVAAEE